MDIGVESANERIAVEITASLRMLREQFNVKYIVLVLDDDNIAEVNPKDKPKAGVFVTIAKKRKHTSFAQNRRNQ